MSAGAALYSHAMASINRSVSASPYTPLANTSPPRRIASHTGSGLILSGNGMKQPTQETVSGGGGNSALRYFEARNAVQRQQLAGGTIPEATPQEGPIPYEELFGSHLGATPSSGPDTSVESPPLSEKEIIRRAFEARDAAAAAVDRTTPTASVSPTVTRTPSVRTMTPPAGPSAVLSEKEVLRRAFEARDAAMLRSGQSPPTSMVPLQPAPSSVLSSPPAATSLSPAPSTMSPMHERAPSMSGNQSSYNRQPASRPSLSEKEQIRLALEARDRALVAQQLPSPPGYEMQSSSPSPKPAAAGPSPLVLNGWNGNPLSAEEQKVQLQAHYAVTDAGRGTQSPLLGGELWESPQSERPEPPIRVPSHKSHKSHKSDTSETFLRRDPSISAGKKRASQILPPPLPPHPPAEYIEETKLEDRRNTLIPPSDFSAPFDLGFTTFSAEPTSSESHVD